MNKIEQLVLSRDKTELISFLSHRSVTNGKTGCREWLGTLDIGGYARINFATPTGRFKIKAHRISHWLFNGPFEESLLVCHKCDNRKCINPAHLFSGTHKDNTSDSKKKGRLRNQHKGKSHCKNGHPLTESNIYILVHNTGRPYRKCAICSRNHSKKRRERLAQRSEDSL
jgi:hypothetical protein